MLWFNPSSKQKWASAVILYVFLAWLSSKSSVPILGMDIPLTLQTVAILSLPFFLPRRASIAGVILWFLLVGLGLPLLSGDEGGLDTLFGLSAGFLGGFIIVTILLDSYAQTLINRSFFELGGVMIAMHFIIIILGLLWMAVRSANSFEPTQYLYAFIPGLLIKGILSSGIVSVGKVWFSKK